MKKPLIQIKTKRFKTLIEIIDFKKTNFIHIGIIKNKPLKNKPYKIYYIEL